MGCPAARIIQQGVVAITLVNEARSNKVREFTGPVPGPANVPYDFCTRDRPA